MHRRAKQFIYLLLFLVFWALVASAVYWLFLKPVPTCFDNRQNQDEEGIDCGGVCQQFCIPATLASIRTTEEPRVFQPIPALTSVLVKIENGNSDFAARSFTYTATVYGDTGKSFTMAGTSFIYAGDIKYLVLLHATEGIGKAMRVTFTASSPVWVPRERFVKPVVRVQNQITTVAEDGSIRVEGIIANNDTLTVTQVGVAAVFVGASGQPIGVSQTEIAQIPAGSTAPFIVVHPPSAGVVSSSTQVFVSAVRP